MAIYCQAAGGGITISRTPVAMDGRIELFDYLYGQSIRHGYHHDGNRGGGEQVANINVTFQLAAGEFHL